MTAIAAILVGGAPPSLQVLVTPASVAGIESGFGGATVTSNTATATPSYGTAPYAYAWSRVSGSADINIDSPTAASTVFSAFFAAGGGNRTGVFICTVTDNVGQIVASNTITVTLRYTDFS